MIDELDLPGSSDFLPFPECDSVFYEDFFEVDALPSTNNEDKVFNSGILIHENLFEVTKCAPLEKNVKKTTNASLILEDFNPPHYELPFHKQVPGLGALLSFSSGKTFKVIKILESSMEIFPCSYKRTSESWMFRVFTSIPLDKLKKRISEKRTKNEAKNDKTEHGIEEHEKDKVKSKPKSTKVKVNPDKVNGQSRSPKKESSDEECSTSGSEDEEYAMAVRDFKKFFKRRECPKPPKYKNQRAFVGGSWNDSGEEDDENAKDETCLVAQASNEICLGVDLEPDEWIKDSG
ncbi:hypothetical protein Tco_0548965 [Tanacetum coccineum]